MAVLCLSFSSRDGSPIGLFVGGYTRCLRQIVRRRHSRVVELSVTVGKVVRVGESVGSRMDASFVMNGTPNDDIGVARRRRIPDAEGQSFRECIFLSLY